MSVCRVVLIEINDSGSTIIQFWQNLLYLFPSKFGLKNRAINNKEHTSLAIQKLILFQSHPLSKPKLTLQ